MKTSRACVNLVFFIGLAPALLAQTEASRSYMAESRALDAEIVRYAEGRGREVTATSDLQSLSQELDELLGDPYSSTDDIARLESRVARLRNDVCRLSEENAASRQRLYERMRRLVALAEEMEDNRQVDLLGPQASVSGLWKVESQPNDVHGLMSLHVEGAVVTGTYRLSNGTKGSVQGQFAGDQLTIKLIEMKMGFVGTATAWWEEDEATLTGRWNANVLNANRAAAGTWSATKVSAQEEAELLQ